MFTGLIEDLGRVVALSTGAENVRLSVATALPMDEIATGDSIAVNGICLTVVTHGKGVFSADVSPETLQRSTLAQLRVGSEVNLERALRLSDRLGGHLVSGHIDTVGKIVRREQDRNAVRFQIVIDPAFQRYVVEKGSVALDGVSLTVNAIDSEGFSVAVIPHSLTMTTLKNCQSGSYVNVETDLLGKYVERLMQAADKPSQRSSLSLEFLAKHGFM